MTEIAVVYAMARRLIHTPSGSSAIVPKGSHWPVGDPVVTAHPDLFSPDPRWGLSYTQEPDGFHDPLGATVESALANTGETASANPGEKRAVKRAS